MNEDQDDSDSLPDEDPKGRPDQNPPEPATDRTGSTIGDKGDKPKGLGWFRKLGMNKAMQPSVSRCVVIGPTAAGKTQLLTSLRRCAAAKSHSYATRYAVSFGRVNDDFRRLDEKLKASYDQGLKLEATSTDECFIPEFTLRVTAETGWPRRIYDTKFRTFEGAGGLLEKRIGEDASRDNAYLRCRKLLEDSLDDCDTVLICLPIVGWVKPEQEQELCDFIDRFLDRRHIRTLVVCMTMYEKLSIKHDLGRNAYRELTTRAAAGQAMRRAFDRQLRGLDNALRLFSKRRKRQVWCVPVSSYGFVPYNGGANLSLIRYLDGTEWLEDSFLRTIPTPADAALRQHIPERPYTKVQAYQTYWRPFLTLDPFAFIATRDDKTGRLIHDYGELRR